jgi:hypothetical protein
MSEEQRYSEAAESDDELPYPQGAAVRVTKFVGKAISRRSNFPSRTPLR